MAISYRQQLQHGINKVLKVELNVMLNNTRAELNVAFIKRHKECTNTIQLLLQLTVVTGTAVIGTAVTASTPIKVGYSTHLSGDDTGGGNVADIRQ